MVEQHPGYCTLCRSRCGSITLVEDGRMVGVEPRPGHPTGGALCAKGRAAPEMVHSPKRLSRPLRRISPRHEHPPRWQEIGWDEALDEIATRLLAIRAESGAEAMAFAVTTPSGTPMVDSYEWVERFIRGFGSPNMIYAIEVCGWHKDYAHALTFGRGLGVPDYDQADLILLWGHNPARTWLAQASRIAEARRRGAKVVVVDPKPDGSGQQADLWLRMRPGADGALAMGAIRHLIETGRFYDDFVRRWTNAPLLVNTGTGAFVRAAEILPGAPADHFLILRDDGTLAAYDPRAALNAPERVQLDARVSLKARDGTPVAAATAFFLLAERARGFTPEHVAALTWLSPADIAAFHALLEGAPRLAYYAWTGVGQHTNATMTERAIASLAALVGACDQAGGNVWTVPPPAAVVNDISLLPPGQREKALGLAELPLGPPAHGWITARDFARAALEGEPYKVRGLMSFGSNFVVSQADAARNLAALAALNFHVHLDMTLNPTAEFADIVLPVNMPWERDALRIGFEITQEAAETVQFRRRVLAPHGESRADYEVVAALATRMGMGDLFFGGDMEACWNHQLAPLGLTVAELRDQPDGVRLPQPFAYAKHAATDADGAVVGFDTPTRRVELYSEQLHAHGYDPLPDFVAPAGVPEDGKLPLVLTTAKSGVFVHTSHRHSAGLRRQAPEPALDISPELAAQRGIGGGDWIRLTTHGGSARLRARLNPALDPRTVVAEFGWWDGCEPLGREGAPIDGRETSNVNAILSDRERDPVSGSVPLRAVSCDVERCIAENRGSWIGERAFQVARTRPEGRDTLAVTLIPRDGGQLPDVLPGQHVLVRLPGLDLARAYSLTGPARSPEHFSIAVRWDAAAKRTGPSLSREIQKLRPGDTVLLEPPGGVFTLPRDATRPVVLLANGIGITPFVGYLESLAQGEAGSHPPRIYLLHGCRSGAEHPLAGRLEELERALPTLRRITAFSRPSAEDRRSGRFQQEGRLDMSALSDVLEHRPLAYLCGSPGFVADLIAELARRGVPRFDIFSESFATPVTVPKTLKDCRVRLAGSGLTFKWSPEAGTILDAAQAAGVALPSGCRVGQCGSCALRVVSGTCAHLLPYDGEPDQCLTCHAVPLEDITLSA